ncbi:MAG TPA: sugar phosphate isomerase/epimerase family protein [Negativicutes bacterium]
MQLLISAATWDKELRSTMKQAELIPLAQELGCSGVEFRPYWQDIEKEIPEIKKALSANNLICTYASNEGLLADSEEETRRVLDSLSANVVLAKSLGTKILRLNVASGPFNPAFIQTDWWLAAVKQVLTLAASMDITLAVENGPDPKKGDLQLLQQILTTVNLPALRLTYDTGNWLYASTKPDQAIDSLQQYIGYVHLKDILSEQGTLKHSYLGTGVVDVKSLACRIQESGYAGPFALEFPGGDNPQERVLQSLKYLGN